MATNIPLALENVFNALSPNGSLAVPLLTGPEEYPTQEGEILERVTWDYHVNANGKMFLEAESLYPAPLRRVWVTATEIITTKRVDADQVLVSSVYPKVTLKAIAYGEKNTHTLKEWKIDSPNTIIFFSGKLLLRAAKEAGFKSVSRYKAELQGFTQNIYPQAYREPIVKAIVKAVKGESVPETAYYVFHKDGK
jgi:hypothetical protein